MQTATTRQTILGDKARDRGVPFIKAYDDLPLVPEAYEESKIFELVDWYATRYGDSLILYGGLTAGSRIHGFKNIRSLSNDLDFVCREEALDDLFIKEQLFYHETYDILFGIVENVPLSFAVGHIHDWTITPDFYSTARPIAAGSSGASIWCSSPEYAIALKLRRMAFLLSEDRPVFGKDALDIINILTAPAFRPELLPIDLGAERRVITAVLGRDSVHLERFLEFILDHQNHLTEGERMEFLPRFSALKAALMEC